MSSLSHHGIKGQRWGVRRFQNKDGTLTREGQIRFAKKNLKHAKVRNLDKWGKSPDSNVLYIIGTSGSGKSTTAKGLAEDGDQVIHLDTIFEKENHGSPDSNKDFEAFLKENNVDIAKASDFSIPKEERWQTYDAIGDLVEAYGQHCFTKGSKVVIEGVQMGDQTLYPDKNYFNGKPTVVLKGNIVRDTFRADRRDGVPLRKTVVRLTDKERWNWYKQVNATSNEIKYTSIGGTMYIEGNALILGDSSYLEHHGIKGQRWGVRRFQNRDGSLTNAGRKRLGYATKGVTQTVKKAFKAGVKTGTKAVKAAKAHHEKAEAKKIEKKKEKASKTRAGVYANKDLFSAKELKELNSKFEEQDKLTAARLKKGVEIAKSVGEIAKSAGEVGKAYEALTGHKLVPDIMSLQNSGNGNNNNNNNNPPNNPPNGGGNGNNNNPPGNNNNNNNPPNTPPNGGGNGNNNNNNNNNNPPNTPPNGGGNGNNNNPPGNNSPGNKPNWTTTPPKLPTPESWKEKHAKKSSDSDLQDQMESARKQASKAMKNAKLQEYIDVYNRDQNSEKNRELASRGQKAIEVLSKGGKFNSEASSSSPTPTPKATPSSNNLMAQIRAAQAKLEKPNKNETPQEHREAQKKANQLENLANKYNAQVNKPGADPAEVTEKLLKQNQKLLNSIKHMDFRDDIYLEHYGVRGMKWGKHLMAGKGGDLYEGTALGAGGGGGPMTEEERKKAEELRKKKLEEAKKKAKEKEIEEKAKEIGISAKAYKRYSIDNNHLPGKHHYDKSQKLHGEASSSVAEAQADERQAHMNRAKAASLMRKVNSSHMFDADGYHISQQRGDDRKEAKRLRKEAKQLDKASKKALKKFYKKRYKSDKERQKWQNSTSGKYHHMMRHYEIQNGVLFINAGDPYLEHHGVKGMKWGKHLMAGKGVDAEGGGGGGFAEDDEKLKEMAKKAGMSVAEYRTKMASKLGGAASKVGSAVYDAAGGSHKKEAEAYRREAQKENAEEQYQKARANKLKAASASEKRKSQKLLDSGDNGGYVNASINSKNWKSSADSAEKRSRDASKRREAAQKTANAEQSKYEKSLAGKYDKMKAGGAKKAKKAVNELSTKVTTAKKRLKDVPGELYGSKHRKDFERNARLLEGSTRSAVEIGRDTYKRHGPTSGFGDPTYKATDDAYKRANKQWNKARVSGQKYDRSIAKSVDSAKRKARLSKDRLQSALGKSKQRKQLSTEGPKAKKQISNTRDDVEKAARSNEAAYRHAKEVYRQTGGDSDAYKQAIKRSRTTLQRSLESQKRLKQKKKAKHSDDTNAVYTEGTRLVIGPKA